MEQVVKRIAPAFIEQAINNWFNKGWIVAALAKNTDQEFIVVFQRNSVADEKEFKYEPNKTQPATIDPQAYQKNGYIAKPF